MSTTTVRTKAADIYKDWHVIDAAGQPLGRVASEAARLIRGKHKPIFEPHLDVGDYVIVINAEKVELTGRKSETKRYYRHSGYPGGLKMRTFEEMRERFPDRIIEQAVWGMLPSGPLGRQQIKHLKVYRGPNHPHHSQVTGSQRAQEARAANAELHQVKPRRLRPLPVPADVAAQAEAREAARVEKKEAAKAQSDAGAEAAARAADAELEDDAPTAQAGVEEPRAAEDTSPADAEAEPADATSESGDVDTETAETDKEKGA